MWQELLKNEAMNLKEKKMLLKGDFGGMKESKKII